MNVYVCVGWWVRAIVGFIAVGTRYLSYSCICVDSNKESDPEKYALTLKLHDCTVISCQYTEDEEKVISCSLMEMKVGFCLNPV